MTGPKVEQIWAWLSRLVGEVHDPLKSLVMGQWVIRHTHSLLGNCCLKNKFHN